MKVPLLASRCGTGATGSSPASSAYPSNSSPVASGTHFPSGVSLPGLGFALHAEIVGVAKAVGEAEVLLGCRLAVEDDGSGILRADDDGSFGFVKQLLEIGAGSLKCCRGLRVDAEPCMDPVIAPDRVPVLWPAGPRIAKDAGAGFHPLLKLNGKGENGGDGQIEAHQARVGEGDIDGAWRLIALVPALAGGDDMEQTADQLSRPLGIFEMEKDVAGQREVVAAQDESLDVCRVQFTHCDRRWSWFARWSLLRGGARVRTSAARRSGRTQFVTVPVSFPDGRR